MNGDKVKISVESFYTAPTTGIGTPLNMSLDNLLSAFTGSGAIGAAKGLVSTTDVQGIANNTTELNNFLSRTPATNQAKAYLNW